MYIEVIFFLTSSLLLVSFADDRVYMNEIDFKLAKRDTTTDCFTLIMCKELLRKNGKQYRIKLSDKKIKLFEGPNCSGKSKEIVTNGELVISDNQYNSVSSQG